MNIDGFIEEQLLSAAMLRTALATGYRSEISGIAEAVASTFLSGHKLLLCGNGGSASDAEHIAAEFVGRFRRNRVPLPAIALTSNGAVLTAIGNDFGFEEVFARQIEALGQPGDLLIALSTSGRSRNVLRAIETARAGGLTTVGLTGARGAELASACALCLVVPSAETAQIQECHMAVCHLVCEVVDEAMLDRQTAEVETAEVMDRPLHRAFA